MTPTPSFCWELPASIAAAVALVIVIGVILNWRIQAAAWRRTVWQVVVAGSLLLLLAESLVALGRRLVGRPAVSWLGVQGMGFRSGLGRRVERLLHLRDGCWPRANRWRASVAQVGGVASLLTLAMTVGAWIQPEQAARTFPEAWEQSVAGQTLSALAKVVAAPKLAPADAQPAPPETTTRSPLDIAPVSPTNLFKPGPGRAALLAAARTPLKYNVEDHAVVLSRKDTETPRLYSRFFRVDRARLCGALGLDPEEATSRPPGLVRFITTNSAHFMARFQAYLRDQGVALTPPQAMFYNDRLDLLHVRATLPDLDVIEKVIHELNPPSQLVIEVKLCEVPAADGVTLELDPLLGGVVLTHDVRQAPEPGGTNAARSTATRILTDPQFRVLLRALEQRPGVDVLAAPKITTLSGRQAQIKVVEVKHVVTGLQSEPAPAPLQTPGATNATHGSRVLAEPVEFGPMIDVVPRVLADGRTIELNVTTAVRELVGYDAGPDAAWDFVPPSHTPALTDLRSLPPSVGPVRSPSTSGAGGGFPKDQTPKPLIRVREARANLKVWDGQTLMLAGGSTFMERKDQGRWVRRPWPATATTRAAPPPGKRLLVFITPTMVDATGNPVHTDEEFPGRLRSVPPQGPLEGK